MSRNAVFGKIDGARAEVVALETLLSSIPAISPDSGGQGEWKKALALESWLKSAGIGDIAWYNCPDERVPGGKRPNLIATIQGQSDSRVWLMSHLDVVPPGELSLWKTDPFTVVEKDGLVYGRVVEDNQQGMVSSIIASLAFLRSGLKPQRTVKLLFVADEEMGSDYGIQYLLKVQSSIPEADRFRPDDLILIPDGGNAQGSEIEVAEKNLLWLKVVTSGKQCHGSVPDEGNNAFLAASDLALRLHDLEKSVFTARDALFCPDRTTLSPTKKEANVPNINTIPGEDVFYMDCRILPVYPVARVLEEFARVFSEIEDLYGVKISSQIMQRVESLPTKIDARILKLLTAAIKDVYAVDAHPVGIGGGTVAAFLRNLGLEAVVWCKIEENAHQPNEAAKLDNILGDAKVMALLMGLPD